MQAILASATNSLSRALGIYPLRQRRLCHHAVLVFNALSSLKSPILPLVAFWRMVIENLHGRFLRNLIVQQARLWSRQCALLSSS